MASTSQSIRMGSDFLADPDRAGVPCQEAGEAVLPLPPTAAPVESAAVSRLEASLAARNATKQLLSMSVTLAVTFAVQFWMPRYFGPEAFGRLHFAQMFATAFFIFSSFGIDIYISKEAGAHPGRVSSYFGGIFVARLIASLLICGAMTVTLSWMQKSAMDWRLAMLFALGQVAFVTNNSLAALLNADGNVNELSVINVIAKIMWGVGVVLVIVAGSTAESVALCFLGSESFRLFWLYRVVRRRFALRLALDWSATWAVVVASSPYFVNLLAHRIYDKVDVNMISVMAGDREVGWYGAACNVAGISLLFIPVVNAVVLPMASRIARGESVEAMNQVMRDAVRLTMVGSSLCCFLLVVHAAGVVNLLFSRDFGPSMRTLQVLAPTFPLTYVCVLMSMHLIQLDKSWIATKISLVGLVLNPTLNFFFIRCMHRWLGDGGAGVGSAGASVLTEFFIAVAMLWALGKAGSGRDFWVHSGKLLAICGSLVVVDHYLPLPWMLRAVVEVALYGVVVLRLRLLPLQLIPQKLRFWQRLRRRAWQAAAP